jgi:hypothetical protein
MEVILSNMAQRPTEGLRSWRVLASPPPIRWQMLNHTRTAG